MKPVTHYIVKTKSLKLPPGVVMRLTEQQAALRQPALKKLKNGLYQNILPVQFKKGESLELVALPSKSILSALLTEEEINALQNALTTPSKPVSKNPKKN